MGLKDTNRASAFLTPASDPFRTRRATSRPVSGRVVLRRTRSTSTSSGDEMTAYGLETFIV